MGRSRLQRNGLRIAYWLVVVASGAMVGQMLNWPVVGVLCLSGVHVSKGTLGADLVTEKGKARVYENGHRQHHSERRPLLHVLR